MIGFLYPYQPEDTIECMPADSPEKSNNPTLVMLVVGVGTLLTAMAGSMVNLALPDLGKDLSVSVGQSRWVAQAYLLVVAVLLPVAGRLSDLLGHRRVYLVGFVLFGAASLECGLSGSLTQLVAWRAAHGVGGAMVMATAPALLTTSFPPSSRGKALGIMATATYIGLTIGPVVGGWIVEAQGWRWTFFFFIPVSVLILVLGFIFLPRSQEARQTGFDWPGATTFLVGLPLLLLAITESKDWGVSSWMTWTAAGGGVGGMTAFIILQRRQETKLLDLSLFKSRVFTGAVVSALANYIALFAPIFLLPFYLEEGLGNPTDKVGMILSSCPLVMALVASPSGWLSDRIGSRGLATGGMLIMAVGLFGVSTLGAGSSTAEVVVWWAVVGLGTGIFISPNSSALMGAAPRHQQGTAGSLLADARVLGMLIGVALAAAIFEAASGVTGRTWLPVDFDAFRLSIRVAGFAALFGALAASLRGSRVK